MFRNYVLEVSGVANLQIFFLKSLLENIKLTHPVQMKHIVHLVSLLYDLNV